MKPAFNLTPRQLHLAALLSALILAGGCATQQAAPPSSPSPTSSPRESALVAILSAQSYAATVADLAGTARGSDQIDEAAYRAVTASGMALDSAWRAAVQALLADTGDLQQRLAVMAEARRNLQLVAKQFGVEGGTEQ